MPVNHISINVSDIGQSREFYLAALGPLGYKVMVEVYNGQVLGLGDGTVPDFWLTGLGARSGDGSDKRHAKGEKSEDAPLREKTGKLHIAFTAKTKAQVHEFYEAALRSGGACNGTPGPRPTYHPAYYAAYVLDPEGRNIEVVTFSGPEVAQ